MTKIVKVGNVEIGGGRPLVLIAGPCVIESLDLCLEVATIARDTAEGIGIPYIFKASFDKANRTSVAGRRGPGMERGLEILATVREKVGVPVLTDVHECCHVEPAAEVVDIL